MMIKVIYNISDPLLRHILENRESVYDNYPRSSLKRESPTPPSIDPDNKRQKVFHTKGNAKGNTP